MPMLLQLLMQERKVRKHVLRESLGRSPVSEQRLVEALLVPILGKRPDHTGCRGPLQILMNSALANGTSAGDGPLPQPQLEAKAKDFLDLAHGQSPGWHPVSPVSRIGETVAFRNVQRHLPVWKTFRDDLRPLRV